MMQLKSTSLTCSGEIQTDFARQKRDGGTGLPSPRLRRGLAGALRAQADGAKPLGEK
jgi:hypothetical protein